MISQPVQPFTGAERRSFTERRRVCLLGVFRGKGARIDARCGLDRRLAVRLQCSQCGRHLFATRDTDRRLILSDRFHRFAAEPADCAYPCPCCGAVCHKTDLQQQQEQLLQEKLHFD